ncbi:nitric oxide-associated protein 1 [Adelges cooleyi]|uniref:nitric oxide-associated protein 1 n=1 Tax=Adelges cooleyi TaxID=133065 RepID=UPI00217F820A|nr:nitric oxide-associated protein 1 [Adelges cooleyi]
MYSGTILRTHLKRLCRTYCQSSSLAKNDSIYDKIVYSSVLDSKKLVKYWRDVKVKQKSRKLVANRFDVEPISLQYLNEYTEEDAATSNETESASPAKPYVLPFSIVSKYEKTMNDSTEDGLVDNNINHDYEMEQWGAKRWMSDYECYEERDLDCEDILPSWSSKYGTPDPLIEISDVPCGGCGAQLQCQNPSIPGYLPSELFCHCEPADLKTMVCQRCHFMQKYNTALAVQVDPIDYPKLLAPLKSKRALIILMVDLTDFPCSIWPNICNIIGKNKPIVVVGNKIDLLPGDCPGWIDNVQKTFADSLPMDINVKHVAVVSAKTGFGIEELINKLHSIWQTKGDVYLIGCTNVGKSTMFNTLLQSDYCRTRAVDLVQRATTSPWPGTTLNLLKFPIMRPSNWRLYLRTQRLMREKKQHIIEKQLENDQKRLSKMKINNVPSIIGRLGQTFYKPKGASHENEKLDPFSSDSAIIDPNRVTSSTIGLDDKDPTLAHSKWLYDTPGVVHPDQSINLLTTEELMLSLPSASIEPRTYCLRSMQTLFIGGLGRIDCLKTEAKFVRFTVFSARTLPITVCHTSDADELYTTLLGSDLLAVPCGSNDRLSKWPGLHCYKKTIELRGINEKTSCADIVLSSAGWVSVSPFTNDVCSLQAWTPERRGIYVRIPSLLKFAVNNRGPRKKFTPTYHPKK